MKQALTLTNPIKINGVETTELNYDTNEITAQLFAQADSQKKTAAGLKNVAIVPAVEFDYSLHLYLGFAAILAVNPHLDWSDVERIHGRDGIEAMKIGRNFILGSEESVQNSSDNVCEATAEPSTQAELN